MIHKRYFALHRFLNFKIDEYWDGEMVRLIEIFGGQFFHTRVPQILHMDFSSIEHNDLIFSLGLHLVLEKNEAKNR